MWLYGVVEISGCRVGWLVVDGFGCRCHGLEDGCDGRFVISKDALRIACCLADGTKSGELKCFGGDG